MVQSIIELPLYARLHILSTRLVHPIDMVYLDQDILFQTVYSEMLYIDGNPQCYGQVVSELLISNCQIKFPPTKSSSCRHKQ